jgi:dCTP deaminase
VILTGTEIANRVAAREIRIDPFDPGRCTTNSYDLALGRRLIIYRDKILDPRRRAEYDEVAMDDSGFALGAGDFVLGETCERFGSDHFVPKIHAKSGIARLGLFVHVTADLIDIGSFGTSTLQLYATIPVRIVPGMLIAQATFWVPFGPVTLYQGKYQHSEGPQISRSYQDRHVTEAPRA